jgi:hypothetical protein
MEQPEERDQIELSLWKRSLQEVGLDQDQALSGGKPSSRLGEAEGAFIDAAVVERPSQALLEKREIAVSAADVENARALGRSASARADLSSPTRVLAIG